MSFSFSRLIYICLGWTLCISLLCCCVPTNLHIWGEKTDTLVSIGVDPDLPRGTLVSALLQSCTEDDLRGMRVKLSETALGNGLAHPKDVLVKRLKRALLKNRKRSAAAFLALRSRSSSNCYSPQTANHLNSSPQSTTPTNEPSDSQSSDSTSCSEISGAIASLTRELGNLRHDITQLKSDIVSLKSTSNNETYLIYVRLRNLES